MDIIILSLLFLGAACGVALEFFEDKLPLYVKKHKSLVRVGTLLTFIAAILSFFIEPSASKDEAKNIASKEAAYIADSVCKEYLEDGIKRGVPPDADTAEFLDSLRSYAECVEASEINQTTLDSAIISIGKGEYQSAIKLLEISTQFEKDSEKRAEMYFYLGISYVSLKDYTRSIDAYTKSLQFLPNNPLVHMKRGIAFRDAGLYDSAVSDFDYALTRNYDSLMVYFQRGLAHSGVRRFSLAISDFTHVILADSTDKKAFTNRGNCYLGLRQYDLAISDYNSAITHDSTHASAHHNKGLALRKIGRIDEAIPAYTKAIELNPHYTEAYTNRGVALAMTSNYEKAISDFTSALAIDETNVKALMNRGMAYFVINELQESARDLDSVLSFDALNKKALVYRARIYFRNGQLDSAVNTIKKFYPNDSATSDSSYLHALEKLETIMR